MVLVDILFVNFVWETVVEYSSLTVQKKKKVFQYMEKLANDVLMAKPALVTEAEIEPLPNKVT